MESARRGPGKRAGLTREAVLAAAREALEDTSGGALSLRALARRLGVAPNALYSHVTGTADLLDAVLDDLLSTVSAPPGLRGRAGLTSVLLAAYDVLVAHAALVPHYLSRQGVHGPHGRRLGAAMDQLLTDAGATDVAAARRALLVHLMGSAAFASSSPTEGPALPVSAVRELYAASATWMIDGILSTRT